MKDLGMRRYTEEESKNIWENLMPGDTLVKFERCGWAGDEYYITVRKVEKKTPKGSVRLDNGNLLKYLPSDTYLATEEVFEWAKKIQLEKELMTLLYEIDRNKKTVRSNLDYDTALQLKEIFENLLKK